MRRRLSLLGALPLIVLVGCAQLSVLSISTDEEDAAANGFRFYESSPYLLVYSDGKGGLISKVLYLPDQTKKRTAVPTQVLASLSTNLTFKDGVLTQATADADAAIIPKEIVKALTALVPLAAQNVSDQGHVVPAPQLFKIVVIGHSIEFIGGPGDKNIRATLVPKDAK